MERNSRNTEHGKAEERIMSVEEIEQNIITFYSFIHTYKSIPLVFYIAEKSDYEEVLRKFRDFGNQLVENGYSPKNILANADAIETIFLERHGMLDKLTGTGGNC